MKPNEAHPILSCADTPAVEDDLFDGDGEKAWDAMQRAGLAVAEGVARDFRELGRFPRDARILVLVGKGHNGGDALIATSAILSRFSQSTAEVVFVTGTNELKPLALRAWQNLQNEAGPRVKPISVGAIAGNYAVSIDGIFGFQFRAPLKEDALAVIQAANQCSVTLRAAVDLPSGLAEAGAFCADFTYATGVVKPPLLSISNAGRLRYLDLGFFDNSSEHAGDDFVLTDSILNPLRGWRDPQTDKRRQGHLFVIAGSIAYPGAALMAVTAALRSGAGLVTAFVPESLVPAFAAQVPEAIWVGWPETPEGGLALEGQHLLAERLVRASALVIGPGMGREPETLVLAADIVKTVKVPVLVDADALQKDVIAGSHNGLVLTPHAGEFARIAGDRGLREYAADMNATVVLKGPVTQISSCQEIYHSLFGGPMLARGGSGDLLAGMIGAQLALTPQDTLGATCRGVAWYGMAADALARKHGATAVRTTQLLDFLAGILRIRS